MCTLSLLRRMFRRNPTDILNFVLLQSDLKRSFRDSEIYKGKNRFDSCGNLIEWIASKPVLASELARGDKFRAQWRLLTPSELRDRSSQTWQGLSNRGNLYVSYYRSSLGFRVNSPQFNLWWDVSRSSDGVRRSLGSKHVSASQFGR